MELKQKANLGFAKRMLAVVEVDEMQTSEAFTDPAAISRIEQLFNESLTVFAELKMEHELARTHLDFANFCKQIGNKMGCEEHLTRARGTLEKLGAPGDLKKIKQAESI